MTEEWGTSSYSAYNGSCVKTRKHEGAVQVRDSKDPGGPVLTFAPADWARFLTTLKAGRPGLPQGMN